MKTYEYSHTVSFEETNLVGNVYYVNHLRWQGRCREMFLRDHAPSVLDELQQGLALVTVHCSCDYFEELRPFDEVLIRMTLVAASRSRLTMDFDYLRKGDLIARGSQQIACMRRTDEGMTPWPLPSELCDALA
jgi:enediyne core biosynthesis thioesterase